jgi:hypothetical protein
MFKPFKLIDKTNNINSSTSVGALKINSTLSNSVRIWRGLTFSSSVSQYLSRTPTIAGNSQIWTWSGWVKPCTLGTTKNLFSNYNGVSGFSAIRLESTDVLGVFDWTGSAFVWQVATERVFRDPSAWYHIIVAVDTTQAIAVNRVRIYVNGIRINSFSVGNYPSQNLNTYTNTIQQAAIGSTRTTSNSEFFDGTLSEITFVDGQQLDQSNFGYFDNLGIWQPRRYGGSYGTNGFYLTFTNTSSLINICRDQSVNNNHWIPQNYGSNWPLFYAVQDSPINNYCILNPLSTSAGTYNFGGLRYLGAGAWRKSNSTFSLNSGKWYYEVKIANAPFTSRSSSTSYNAFGFGLVTAHDSTTAPNSATDVLIYSDNGFYKNFSGAVTDGGYTIVTNDVLAVAVDLDANTFTFYRNNFAVVSGTIGVTAGTHLTPICYSYSNAYGVMDFNFGQQPFVFTPPAGYKAICSNNITGLTIPNGKTYFDIATYDGGNSVYATDVYADFLKLAMPFSPYQTNANIAMTLSSNKSRIKIPTSTNVTYPTNSPANQKFYSGAALFNNLGTSRITIPNDADFQFGTGDFTIEGWVNSVALKANGIFAKCSVDATWVSGWTCEINSGYITFYNGTTRYTGATNLMAINTWYHVAWTRENGTLRQFVNGNLVRTDAGVTTSLSPTSNFSLGNDFTTNTYSLNAYIQDFRIYKNVAKYTSAFTPPTAMVTSEGSGGNKTVSSFNFSPDLLWIKSRSAVVPHTLNDSVRGAGYDLYSNLTNAEAYSALVTSFNSNGFSLGADGGGAVNLNYLNYVAWSWDAGSTISTNTSGSITSTVRSNPQAGFSIVSFVNASGTNQATVGHGLGIAPRLIIAKNRDTNANNWAIFHSSVCDTTSKFLQLNTTAALTTFSTVWGAALPTSSVFGVTGGGIAAASVNVIAYCFAEIEGYSRFGSYTGNGATNGTFIWCGFKPKFLLVKSTGVQAWWMLDTIRGIFNVLTPVLQANVDAAEVNSGVIDMTSNGFKLRTTDAAGNSSGQSYIYAAFAENPFRYMRAV